MSVKTSKKANDITTKDLLFYTGLIPYKIVAVNPNLAELKELGIEYQQEPQYIHQNDDGSERALVRFYLENREFTYVNEEGEDVTIPEGEITRVTNDHWISAEDFVGQNSGKTQYVNKYGRTTWALDMEDLETKSYFQNVEARAAKKGEEALYKFIFAWANMVYNVKTETFDECRVDISKVLNGDASELKAVVANLGEYTIKLLTGLKISEKEGTTRIYQATYSKHFLKHNQESYGYFKKYVDEIANDGEAYNAFKADFYSWEIECYKREAAAKLKITPDEDPGTDVETEKDPF